MQAFTFEFYIMSLVILSKYHAVASSVEAENNFAAQEQTTGSKPKKDDVLEKKKQDEAQAERFEFKGKISPFEQYKKLFSEHRATQLNAVKAMQKFGNPEAQFKLVDLMLKQLFKNLEDARQNLTMWGFLPGDEFPKNETIRESMSKVLENTALFGDMLLRLPKAVHEFYDRSREWQILMGWAFTFSNQSGVFEGPHDMLLSLMGQEAGLIPKSPNYINPFLASEEEEKQKVPVEVMPKKEKQKKAKKIPRGPRMSRTDL
ncbi:coiled-coil domain-containing protein 134-like [Babylonia areolata]|uniref:coiled-coil domain-containing protein 134-like n=1 Tax=Babylonia areolata TaxID=304850 RepID=UPI003FD0EA89